jgi:glucokinase
MTRLVAVDIGGTNARFAIARVEDGVISVGEPVTLKTSDHVSLQTAWQAFEAQADEPVPRAAAIAIAAPISGQVIRMTNNSWVLDTAALDRQLELDRVTVLNDFGAVAHAVAQAPAEDFVHIAGPDGPLPTSGTISVVGPGTGLGVAQFHRFSGGYHVQATEGGHADFAPVDAIDDAILARTRAEHRRVSTERINSGPGILPIYRTLCALEGRKPDFDTDREIWDAALAGTDMMAKAAMARLCMTLGSVAGDIALTHGASAVVLAGGLGLRLRAHLPGSGFAERFAFKGRYEGLMAGLPVKLIVQPEPGLYGAVAAFLQQHGA